MSYTLSFSEANSIFDTLQKEYEIWAPKRFTAGDILEYIPDEEMGSSD